MKFFIFLFLLVNLNADNVKFGVGTDYQCVTDYLVESDGSINKNIPSRFSNPILTLTSRNPDIAILRMNDGTEKLFKATEKLNLSKEGKGISYHSGNAFLDVFASGKVYFGIKDSEGYHKTMKFYCKNIRNIDYLK